MKWYTRIKYEDFRQPIQELEESKEGISKGCEIMMKVIEQLITKIPSEYLKQIEEAIDDIKLINKHYIWYKIYLYLDECKDHFDFCNDLTVGNIPREEWEDYSFDGNYLRLFNSYLKEFYDICDTVVDFEDNKVTKFCWLELN